MKAWDDLKAIPRPVWTLSFATFVNRAGSMVLPFLLIYLTHHLGFTAARAGFVLALYGIGALITAPAAGFLCDRYGSVRIIKTSLFANGILLLGLPFIRDPLFVTIAVFVLAIVAEMLRPASMAAVTQFVTPQQRKTAYALSRLAINLGMSIGPAAGGFLAAVSYSLLFWIDGATAILAGILLVFAALPNPKRTESTESSEHKLQASFILNDSRFVVFLVSTIPIAFVFFQHIFAMPLYMIRDLGMTEKVYGLMFTLNTLLIVALELPINLTTTHWSSRKALVLGTMLCALGFGALAFATNVITVMATVVVWTFGEMILFPAMSAYVAHIAPPHKQGAYMGFYVMAFGVGFALAPWGGTQLLNLGGFICWGAIFIIGASSAVMMAIFVK
ncbi:MFS transporter [bacterium]|nr:MFS transporter [bacterium]